MKTFSIITVTFNAGHLIEETISSVLNQDTTDYEYIIIDGKSTDDTLKILEEYRDKINQVISEPDNGIYDAMNKGLKIASGKYVVYLNAGDSFNDTSVLSTILTQSKKKKEIDVFYGETIIIDNEGKVFGTRSELTSRKLPGHLSFKSLLNGQVVSHQSFIPKRILAEPYDLKYKCSADIDWMLRILKNAKVTQKTDLPIAKYLIGGKSDSNLIQCWWERFSIMLKYYSPVLVLLYHIKFILRYFKYRRYRLK